jgi:hypothetical protein
MRFLLLLLVVVHLVAAVLDAVYPGRGVLARVLAVDVLLPVVLNRIDPPGPPR